MIWIIFSCILTALAGVQYLVYLMHMFQLNTYKNNEQLVWNKKNITALRHRTILPLLAGAAYLIVCWKAENSIPTWKFIVYYGFLAAHLWLYYPRHKAKKPLVYTGRVIRMLITHLLLLAAVVVVALILIPTRNLPFLLIVWYVTLPYLILLVNRMNEPVQKTINQHYIREAKKKIADMPELIVVGITGSYGKTSVKFFLTELLSCKYNVLCTPRNYNTELGVTRTIREDMQPTHEVFVCEMGARYVQDIAAICDIVKPRLGVITTIGPQHLETFGSMENIVKTKFELYDALPQNGMAFLNYDNEYILKHRPDKPQTGFGWSQQAQIRLLKMHSTPDGTDFTISVNGKEAEFHTDLLGYHNILDITAAIAVADYLQVPISQLARRVRKLRPVEHRLQMLPKKGRVSIIDDAYNSNPQGFCGAVDTLYSFEGRTRVLITPGMIELGEKEYELNKEVGRYAAGKCDYIILVGKKQTQALMDGINEESGFDHGRVWQVNTLQEAWGILSSLPGDELIVLLENDLPDNY